MVALAVRATPLRFVLVMGVCGVGKSTIAKHIADLAHGRLIEADDYHSPDNKQAMAGGRSLTDEQRWPWLDAVAAAAKGEVPNDGKPVFIACSALKRRYRDFLREKLGHMPIVYLTGEPSLIRQRLEDRRSHFMPPHLLDSQLADLEEPGPDEGAITIDIEDDPKRLVHDICGKLGLDRSQGR